MATFFYVILLHFGKKEVLY